MLQFRLSKIRYHDKRKRSSDFWRYISIHMNRVRYILWLFAYPRHCLNETNRWFGENKNVNNVTKSTYESVI